jgi:hypothetical protein
MNHTTAAAASLSSSTTSSSSSSSPTTTTASSSPLLFLSGSTQSMTEGIKQSEKKNNNGSGGNRSNSDDDDGDDNHSSSSSSIKGGNTMTGIFHGLLEGIGFSLHATNYYSKSFLAGGIAGAIAKTSVAPLERTKIIFQTSSARFSLQASAIEMFAIVEHEGFTALWRGHAASLVRVIPYSAIQLTTFDIAKVMLMKEGETDLRPIMRVLSGAIAGGISVLFTYPLDLLRARMAVQRHKHPIKGALRNSFNQVIEKEGIIGLFRGLVPTLVGIVPYSGLAFGSFGELFILLFLVLSFLLFLVLSFLLFFLSFLLFFFFLCFLMLFFSSSLFYPLLYSLLFILHP